MENNYRPNFFIKIWKSITDFGFYKYIITESMGRAFGYLILLSIILGIIFGGVVSFSYSNLMKETAGFIQSEEMPYFELIDGRLEMDIDKPIVIEDPNMIIIVDNKQEYTYNDIVSYPQGYLITPEHIIYVRPAGQPLTINFKDLQGFNINKDSLAGFLTDFTKFIAILIFLGIIVGTLLLKLLEGLIASIIGIIVNSVLNANMSYENLYKIGIYSLTLPSIVVLILNSIPVYVPLIYTIFIYIILVCVYMVKVLKLMKEDGLTINQ